MELRNGVNCMDSLLNNKTKRLEAVFLPCSFKHDQKWDFKQDGNESYDKGIIINRGSGKCLTFEKEYDNNLNSNVSKKKETMLTFLAKVVKETIEKVEVPYISDCEKLRNSTASNLWKESQLWLMNNTTGSNSII